MWVKADMFDNLAMVTTTVSMFAAAAAATLRSCKAPVSGDIDNLFRLCGI
jgi:hypothetical protein